jgi:hypothetical protein
MRKEPDPWIEPLDVKVLGLNDSVTEAALALIKPKIPNGPNAVQNQKPFPGMTRFAGSTLGGVSIDGAFIYPPLQADASA